MKLSLTARDEWYDSLLCSTVTAPSTRNFFIKLLLFDNGCFLVVSEDSSRIGAMYVSISSSNKIDTAKVIPSKHDSMFTNTLSQRVSSLINGVCVVCVHSIKQLQFEDMKSIMEKIMNMVEKSIGK